MTVGTKIQQNAQVEFVQLSRKYDTLNSSFSAMYFQKVVHKLQKLKFSIKRRVEPPSRKIKFFQIPVAPFPVHKYNETDNLIYTRNLRWPSSVDYELLLPVLTLGASIALESSCGCAFSLAEPSRMDGSSLTNSLDPIRYNNQHYRVRNTK